MSQTIAQARRLLVVEDEPFIAGLLAKVLTGHGYEVRIAADVIEARAAVREFDPDGVLLDITLGSGPSGLDLGYVLAKQRPEIGLIFLTKHTDPRTAGIDASQLPFDFGFLRKDRVHNSEYLLSSIQAVLDLEPVVVRDDQESSGPLTALSDRQLEVLRLLATGYTNERICEITRAATSTVGKTITEIFKALGIDALGHVNQRAEAIRIYVAEAGVPERL